MKASQAERTPPVTKPVPMKHAAFKHPFVIEAWAIVERREAVKQRGRAAARKRNKTQKADRRKAERAVRNHH